MTQTHKYSWVTERVCCDDLLCALNALDGQQLAEYLPARGRSIEVTLMKRTRASSLGAVGGGSSIAESKSTLGLSDDGTSDDAVSSSGSQTPPSRSFSLSNLSVVSGRRKGFRSPPQELAKSVRLRMEMTDEPADDNSDEAKPAAVTAAVITFMLAMLSCPLAPCLPPTHVHLSRLPIGTGHSVVLDALRREWPDHDFDIKLHVYQKTRHVSGVAAITPGLLPDELEQIRLQPDNLYLPLVDSGDKMIVDESKRDRDPVLMKKYQNMVLQGLGMHVEGIDPLSRAVPPGVTSPIVYLRIMADRANTHGLLSYVTDIRDEGLLYILDRFAPVNGKNLSEYVRLVAPDKSASRQHMHRSHFGRAYFIECVDVEAAGIVMRSIQKDSIQNVDSMRLSLHVEIKRCGGSSSRTSGGLFEQDLQKRCHVEHRLETAKAVMETLEHRPCTCPIPEPHTMAMHSLFCFRWHHRSTPSFAPYDPSLRPTLSVMNSSFGDARSCYGESMMGAYDMSDTMSVASFSTVPNTPVIGCHDAPVDLDFDAHHPHHHHHQQHPLHAQSYNGNGNGNHFGFAGHSGHVGHMVQMGHVGHMGQMGNSGHSGFSGHSNHHGGHAGHHSGHTSPMWQTPYHHLPSRKVYQHRF